MSVQVVVDVNLSPRWVAVLKQSGWHTVHWSTIGRSNAPDREIMDWARANSYVVFTHDLDFGSILATTHADSPSVIQIRTQDVLPQHLEGIVVAALRQYESLLEAGALIVVDENKLRARVLPLHR